MIHSLGKSLINLTSVGNITKKIFGIDISIENHLPVLDLVHCADGAHASEVSYATSLSAGFDLPSAEDCVLEPGKWKLVDTGLQIAQLDHEPVLRITIGGVRLELVAELQVRPRSGLATKHGVTVLNSPGTIDADYEGRIKVCLINHGAKEFHIRRGDRIAQGVFGVAVRPPSITVAKKTRGAGGFGSTDKKS